MNGLEALGTFGTANIKPKDTPITSKTTSKTASKTTSKTTSKTASTGTSNRTSNRTSKTAGNFAGIDTSKIAGTGAGMFEALRLLGNTRDVKLTLTIDQDTADKFKTICEAYSGSQANIFTLMTAVFHHQLIGSAGDE